jgi:hypothetical protein
MRIKQNELASAFRLIISLVATPALSRDSTTFFCSCTVVVSGADTAIKWIKQCHTRYLGLRALGVSDGGARPVAGSRRGRWAMSDMKPVKVAMPNLFFAERGLLSLLNQYEALAPIT